MKIAWIGVGVMGRPMALNLKNAGYDVHVYNRTFSKAKTLEEFGLKAHNSIASVVSDADFIFTIVGYPKDVMEVYEEIFVNVKDGAILIDMTTSSPTLASQLYKLGISKNVNVLDAPVTGGDVGAINATLSIMVGGDESAFKQALPLFKHLGSTINYMGTGGNGQHAKLANQAAIAGAIAGAAESITYAKEKGLNLENFLDVITNGSASSWQSINNGPKMVKGDDDPGFYIKHFLKDLNLILEEAKNFKPKVVQVVRNIYEKLNDDEFGDLGTQAIIKYYLSKK